MSDLVLALELHPILLSNTVLAKLKGTVTLDFFASIFFMDFFIWEPDFETKTISIFFIFAKIYERAAESCGSVEVQF